MSARNIAGVAVALACLSSGCSPSPQAPATAAPAATTAPASATDPSAASLNGDLTLFGKGVLWSVSVTGPSHALVMTRPMFEDVRFAASDVQIAGDAAKITAKDAKNDIAITVTRKRCEPGMNAPAVPFEATITFTTDESKVTKTFPGCGGPGKLPLPGKLPG